MNVMTEFGKIFKFKEPLSFGESRAEPTLKFYAFRLIIDIRVTLVSSYLTKKTGWPLLESLSSASPEKFQMITSWTTTMTASTCAASATI